MKAQEAEELCVFPRGFLFGFGVRSKSPAVEQELSPSVKGDFVKREF